MPSEISEVALLKQLRELRRSRRRFSASIITTYTVNFPFYENVVLRYLLGAGSRLNILLADAGEISKAFLTESSRPRGAGLDYLLLPISTGGAFHPKILSLFSDVGMAIAVGSHNLTEAGFGRNVELSSTFGFGESSAPLNIAQPVVDYLLQCADQLAKGDASLSIRLADRLRSLSLREKNIDEELAFAASEPEGAALLDRAFLPSELEKADRILVLGPYFDNDLRFLTTLRERASRAEIVVAIQPEYAVMKRVDSWPAKTRLCDANALKLPKAETFMHAKAIVIEAGKKLVLALGSANPSAPAWLGKGSRRNFEAMVILRGRKAIAAFRDLGLDELWKAPTITKKQLEQIAARSRVIDDDTEAVGIATVAGLWKNGWVEPQLASGSKQIRSISRYDVPVNVDLPIGAAKIENNVRLASLPSDFPAKPD
jgi:PLD-like domain